MDELILSFDSSNYSLNEGRIADAFLNIIDKILTSIIEFLQAIREKIRKLFKDVKEKEVARAASKIDISKINGDFEYYVPNKESIKVYLDAIYVESFNKIINRCINLANRGNTKDLYIELFGKYPTDTYSDDNNYIYGIIKYLETVFKTQCRDKEDLNKQLAKCLTDKSNIRHVNSTSLKAQLSNNKDINRTNIGRDLKLISDTRDFTLNYFNQITNKAMVDIKKLKKDIENNVNSYNDEIKEALLRMAQYYMKIIKDSNIEGAIKGITKMEDIILNKIKSWSKGEN